MIDAGAATLACLFSFIIIYGIATEPPAAATRNAVLEALCTVVLVLLCVQAVERAIESLSSMQNARSDNRRQRCAYPLTDAAQLLQATLAIAANSSNNGTQVDL